MKNWNWTSFIFGIGIGALVTMGIAFHGGQEVVTDNLKNIPGLTLLKNGEQGTFFGNKSMTVLQALSRNRALAITRVVIADKSLPLGDMVFYIAPENVDLYDGQVIEIPNGKRLTHIGTYEYKTKSNEKKTVPAVIIK